MEAMEVMTKLNEVYKNKNLMSRENTSTNKLKDFMQRRIIISNEDLYNLMNHKQPSTKLINQPQVMECQEYEEIYYINLLAKFFKVSEFEKLQKVARCLAESKSIYFAV